MSDYADKAAEKIVERCGLDYQDCQLNPIDPKDIAAIIRECTPDQSVLGEAVKNTLVILNAWGTAKHSNKAPTAAEWSAYQGMVMSNYIALAARLRAALDQTKPKVCECPEGACPTCWGTGWVEIRHANQCPTCSGRIEVKENRNEK